VSISIVDWRDRVLDRLARKSANDGKLDIARIVVAEAHDPTMKAFGYTVIARLMIRSNHTEEARATLRQAIEAARSISDRYLAALAFAEVGYG
jgi:uncharacterized protein HemY